MELRKRQRQLQSLCRTAELSNHQGTSHPRGRRGTSSTSSWSSWNQHKYTRQGGHAAGQAVVPNPEKRGGTNQE